MGAWISIEININLEISEGSRHTIIEGLDRILLKAGLPILLTILISGIDENLHEPQKIGALNRQGWVRYRLPDAVFTKRFRYRENAAYPDMNSNTELYTAGSFVEVESLAPLVKLQPGEATEHAERWELAAASNSIG